MRAAIGGIVKADGGPVEAEELSLLVSRARVPGAGKPRIFQGAGFGLIWVPAIPDAAAPDSGGRCVVVLDGTLDNRTLLARELGLSPEAAVPGAQPLLIAAAYERWGLEATARLNGEFAFLLWDRIERRLVAARDDFGARELFFTEAQGAFRIASQLQMLGRPNLSDLDDEYVADFLTGQVSIGPATPFRSIRRLLAGHRLTVTAEGRPETRRSWDLHDLPPLHYKTDAEYLDHFLAVFREAVERSLETGGRAWAELSGGLDSSSIVCVAHEVLQEHPGRAGDFATVTFVWDETPQSDEREWSQTVVRKYDLVNHQIRSDDLFFDDVTEAALHRSEPHFGIFAHPMYRAEVDLLRRSGVEVLLCGSRAESVVLADQTPPVHLVDLFRRLRLFDFSRELLRWQRGTHRPLANLFFSFVLEPLLRPHSYRRSSEDERRLDPWVSQDFARRLGLRDRLRRRWTKRTFPTLAQEVQYERLRRSEQMVHRGYHEWTSEARHPFLYRPLVELAFSIPWEKKVDPELGKLLLRRSLTGRLPDEVRTRRNTRGPGPSAYKAYAKRWAAIEPIVRKSVMASMGFLDAAELSRAAELVRFGSSSKFGAFTSCLAFEFWLRAVTGVEA